MENLVFNSDEPIHSDEPIKLIDKIVFIYQEMTGKIIPETQIDRYKALGKRAIRALETKLGWQFDREDYINVVGVNPFGCKCKIDFEKLEESPATIGQLREFNFNKKEPYVFVDPFKKINSVYLCRVNPEGEYEHTDKQDVVILGKIEHYTPRYFSEDFGKYLQSCKEMTECQSLCNSECKDCSRLLLDAEWLDSSDIPEELLYLICDYIDWLDNDGVGNRGIKSESVDGHSVSYGNDGKDYEPYENPVNKAIIAKYTGPYGAVGRQLIY